MANRFSEDKMPKDNKNLIDIINVITLNIDGLLSVQEEFLASPHLPDRLDDPSTFRAYRMLLRGASDLFRTMGPEAFRHFGIVGRTIYRTFEIEWLNLLIRRKVDEGLVETYDGKRWLAKRINARLREKGLWICHPDTLNACILYAIADGVNGKFVLEDKETKKRSRTTKNILSMMPFHLNSYRDYRDYMEQLMWD